MEAVRQTEVEDFLLLDRGHVQGQRLLRRGDHVARRPLRRGGTDHVRLRALAESSPAVATGLNPYLGYEEVASVVEEALRRARTVRDRGRVPRSPARRPAHAGAAGRGAGRPRMARPHD